MLEDRSSAMKVLLETRDLDIGYRNRKKISRVASGLRLQVKTGELICLAGQNGAGKSTLLRTLAGVQKPLSGKVLLDGSEIISHSQTSIAKKLGLVLTEKAEAEGFSVRDIVALGRFPHTDWKGILTPADQYKVDNALNIVGADPLSGRLFTHLSDGEKQKVMIARAIAQETDIILLDEPTAFLDLLRKIEIINILRDLASSGTKGILMAIHDISLALQYADRIWLFEPEGGIIEGSPEDLVLSGAIERAFSSEKLTFDPVSGQYPVYTRNNIKIALKGTGRVVYWTAKGLARQGFKVCSDDPSARATVIVTEKDGSFLWEVSVEDEILSSHTTVLSMTDQLKEMFIHRS